MQVPRDQLDVPHVTEVTGGDGGTAYVAWLSDSNPQGYAEYLRAFSIIRGWLSGAVQVSAQFGDSSVWPGDTFGISTLAADQIALSWGGATPASGKKSDIYAASIGIQSP